ncbi:MAG: hypothetical protein U9R47_01305 [Actinomycetota bacterium]|nr:hypothetical protein [Actinomycetota bacterium]
MVLRIGFALLAAAVVMVAACSAGSSDEPQDTSGSTVSSTVPVALEETAVAPPEGDGPIMSEPLPTTPPLSTARSYEGHDYPIELTGFVTWAVDDLAEYLSVESSSIVVGSVEEVVWPNGGLGCPRPDMKYAQVPVDGLRIVLIHDGVEYVYHSGGSAEPFLCAPELVKVSSGSIVEQGGSTGIVGGGDEDSTDGIIQTEKTVPSEGSVPTEQPGGPGDPDV